jgi:predicted secreted hydrolase
MGSDTTGYRRATAVRPFSFPADHGPHPGYKTEWWYVTGTLTGPEAQPYGYELTLFRIGLTPPDAAPDSTPSDWRTNQLYMGHFAVTRKPSTISSAFSGPGRAWRAPGRTRSACGWRTGRWPALAPPRFPCGSGPGPTAWA